MVNPFERTYLINLSRRPDRLERFRETFPACLGEFEIWPAVDGNKIKAPRWWTNGPGAWGCYRSHLQVLEKCYQDNVESYIVFEDDAIFRDGFESEFAAFMTELPHDWEMVYFGGQLTSDNSHPPTKVSDHVYAPYTINRTHCFAVHRRGYEKIYQHVFDKMKPTAHIDHHLQLLHESGRLKLYCPNRWLVGQDAGPSDISRNNNSATFWNDPEKATAKARLRQRDRFIPSIFLESSIEVAIELERRGWHRGHWQNEQHLDRGICNALSSADVCGGLKGWHKAVMTEAVREGKSCVCLYHPSLTWEVAESLGLGFIRVQSETVEQAESQIRPLLEKNREPEFPKNENPSQRNLLYHIWPRTGNGVWQWNVEQLLKRIDQFDGTRSIAVVTDGKSDSFTDVRSAFGSARIDNWFNLKNDPKLREGATFKSLMETVKETDGITFFAHAKGVQYDNPTYTRAWTSAMYEICLDDPGFINEMLRSYSIVGPFKTSQTGWRLKYGYFFSGTYFWFWNREVFAYRDWEKFDRDAWSIEKWPGGLFSSREAGCLFGPEVGRLYDESEWNRVETELKIWRENRRKVSE